MAGVSVLSVRTPERERERVPTISLWRFRDRKLANGGPISLISSQLEIIFLSVCLCRLHQGGGRSRAMNNWICGEGIHDGCYKWEGAYSVQLFPVMFLQLLTLCKAQTHNSDNSVESEYKSRNVSSSSMTWSAGCKV